MKLNDLPVSNKSLRDLLNKAHVLSLEEGAAVYINREAPNHDRKARIADLLNDARRVFEVLYRAGKLSEKALVGCPGPGARARWALELDLEMQREQFQQNLQRGMCLVQGMVEDEGEGGKFYRVARGSKLYDVAERFAAENGGSIGCGTPNWVEVRVPFATPNGANRVYINRK